MKADKEACGDIMRKMMAAAERVAAESGLKVTYAGGRHGEDGFRMSMIWSDGPMPLTVIDANKRFERKTA